MNTPQSQDPLAEGNAVKVSRTEAIRGLQAEAAPPEHIKSGCQAPRRGMVPHRKNALQGPPLRREAPGGTGPRARVLL